MKNQITKVRLIYYAKLARKEADDYSHNNFGPGSDIIYGSGSV
jgi:hypothetical protein